jgi:hypothetical protein
MNLEQRLRESLVAPDPGAVFTARVMARMTRGRARRGRRFIVIGAVLVAGVAAAMLVWQTSEVRPTPQPAEIAVTPTIRDPTLVAVEKVVQPAPVAEESLAAPPMLELPPAASPHYSVLVMPLRQEGQDVAGRSQVEAFHSSVVDELRKAPGVVLQVPGGSADYMLTITSLAERVTCCGSVQMRATDGGDTHIVRAGRNPGAVSVERDYKINPLTGNTEYGESRSYEAGGSAGLGSVAWIELRVESRGAASARYTFPIGVEGSGIQRPCASSDARLNAECLTPAKLAARQVEKLRMQVFPPDIALQQRIVARLGNERLTQAEQFQLLNHLLMLQDQTDGSRQGRASRLDGTTLLALTRIAARLPAFTRAQVWTMLRHGRVSHPVLIEPLVDSLRSDTDRQVRLEALAALMANYAAEPSVRTLLGSVAQQDPDEVVRIAVRRQLYGQTQWRSDVIAVLNNTALPYESRVAPLRQSTSGFSVSLSGDLQALTQDRQVLLKLIELVRDNLGDSGNVQATREMLILLAGTNDPLVSELFDEARRKGIQPPVAMSGSFAINSNGEVVTGSTSNGDSLTVPSALLERMQEITGQEPKPAAQ